MERFNIGTVAPGCSLSFLFIASNRGGAVKITQEIGNHTLQSVSAGADAALANERMRASFGQSIIVENMSGANGGIGVGPSLVKSMPLSTFKKVDPIKTGGSHGGGKNSDTGGLVDSPLCNHRDWLSGGFDRRKHPAESTPFAVTLRRVVALMIEAAEVNPVYVNRA